MKHFLGMDVFAAARLRLEEIFDSFERVYVSFSGGKDSGLVVQYALEIAREKGRLPLDVLHVDLEAWYAHTDAFVTRIMTRPDVRPCWVCLPFTCETRFPRCNRIGCAGILTRGSCGFVSSPGIRG